MVNEDVLIVLSKNKGNCLFGETSAIWLEVEYLNERRSVNCLHYLSTDEFNELKSFLLNAKDLCKRERTLPIVEDILELQYAISLLKEHVHDFTVADILELYKSNKKLLMPTIYIKKMISRLRKVDRDVEAEGYLTLLNKLLEYSPDTLFLDVTMMDANWFELFGNYLENKGCSKEEFNEHLCLLKQVYADICKLNGAKVICCSEDCIHRNFFKTDFIYSFVERELRDFFNRDFVCSFAERELQGLFEKHIEDGYLVAVRNLLFLKYWSPEISFFDLLDLKIEDVHSDGIWYRRRSDNKLCFVKLSSEVVNTIKKKMDRGDNLLFPCPFDKIKDEHKRIQLKADLYMQQIRKFVGLYPVILKEIDLLDQRYP